MRTRKKNNKTKKTEEKKNGKIMPTTCSPNPKPNQSNPIICNNSKIDMSFLVQMTQSNKMWKCKE